MKRNALAKTERRIVNAWKAAGLKVNAAPAYIREKIRKTAYHEAGHVAARMFTGHEAGHIIHVSIIPEGFIDGHERSNRNYAESLLSDYHEEAKRANGRCLLLGLLAGRGAEYRIAAPDEREDILDENAIWEQGEEEGTDLFRALRVADVLARPGMPARRVLALAEKWTVEMLALPEVWRTVETLAGTLLERGIITDAKEILATCESILDLGMSLSKWKQRLGLMKKGGKKSR